MRTRAYWLATHGVLRAAARIGAWQGDLLARLVTAKAPDPALIDELSRQEPLMKGRLGYLTTSHAAAHEVLRSGDFQSITLSGPLRPPKLHILRNPSLLPLEGVEHTRHRKSVAGVLTPRVVASLRAGIEHTAAGLLEGQSGTVDIVETYCSRLPVAVMADILGVPESERPSFGFVSPSLDLALPWADYQRGRRAAARLASWIAEQRSPVDNWMNQLIEATQSHEAQLSDDELRGGIATLTLAGFEGVSNLVASAIRMVLDTPVSLGSNLIDEVLRLEPPVQFTARQAVRDTVVAGVDVGCGELVTVYVPAANRDPRVFTDPHRFDAERKNAGRHLSFSSGAHLCPGNRLARLYAEVGLRAFCTQFPGARLAGDGVRKATPLLRGWSALPVALA